MVWEPISYSASPLSLEQREIMNLDRKIAEIQKLIQNNFLPQEIDSSSPTCTSPHLLLHSLLHKQEMSWKQKAHDPHIFLGDKNTQFFHNKVQKSRWTNRIHCLKHNKGSIICYESKMAAIFLQSWKQKMTTGPTTNFQSIQHLFPSVIMRKKMVS